MSNDKPPATPVAEALRKAGYIPLPRLWVKADAIPEVHAITGRYTNEVNTIRARIHGPKEPAKPLDPIEQAKLDKEAAWAAYEKMRAG